MAIPLGIVISIVDAVAYPSNQKPDTSPTCSSWVSNSTCSPVSTPSAPTIAEPSSSTPFWNSCSSTEKISPLPMPSLSDYNTPTRSSSPWTTRKVPSEGILYLTYDRITQPPALSEQASTSSSDCKNRDAIPPLLLVTINPPNASAPSAPQALSLSSGRNAYEWGHPDSDFTRRMLGCTLSALVEPWPCTSPTSWIKPS